MIEQVERMVKRVGTYDREVDQMVKQVGTYEREVDQMVKQIGRYDRARRSDGQTDREV
ncbi:MAG: hypothetical protein H6633_28940 [Anaerolineales bacterium]|nr:hypothetical protein [Anaerolineales bacterium]